LAEQGKQIALALIGMFGVISLASVVAVSFDAILPTELTEIFSGISELADVFVIGMIIAFFLASRGQTAEK